MAEPLATGNPVFDFRASHRVFAVNLQRCLMIGGGLLFLASLLAFERSWMPPRLPTYVPYGALAGAILFTAGIQWGFSWRKRLRADFRREHGL